MTKIYDIWPRVGHRLHSDWRSSLGESISWGTKFEKITEGRFQQRKWGDTRIHTGKWPSKDESFNEHYQLKK